jgi:erythromycin esterase
MLKFIPTALRGQLLVWEKHQQDPDRKTFKTFQETRDQVGAENILKIAENVSKSGKVIVWAHNLHVFHNAQKKSRHSLGADLKEKLGDQLYTIGLFADKGETYFLADMEDFLEAPLKPGTSFGFETELIKITGNKNAFLDFSSLAHDANKWLNAPTTTRVENFVSNSIPGKDFDAAIFISDVSKPKLPWLK